MNIQILSKIELYYILKSINNLCHIKLNNVLFIIKYFFEFNIIFNNTKNI